MFKKTLIVLLALIIIYKVLPTLFFFLINIPVYIALAFAIIVSTIAGMI